MASPKILMKEKALWERRFLSAMVKKFVIMIKVYV